MKLWEVLRNIQIQRGVVELLAELIQVFLGEVRYFVRCPISLAGFVKKKYRRCKRSNGKQKGHSQQEVFAATAAGIQPVIAEARPIMIAMETAGTAWDAVAYMYCELEGSKPPWYSWLLR